MPSRPVRRRSPSATLSRRGFVVGAATTATLGLLGRPRPVRAQAAPKAGGTLTAGVAADAATLDPHMSGSSFDRQLFHALYNPLVNIDRDLKIVPDLAESWEVPDPATYVFRLRKGVRFHDGTELTAEVAKWNFERMMGEKSQRRSELTPVDHVEVVDPVTVRIKLKTPFAPFLSLLTDRAGMMVSRAAVEKHGADFATHPVGTGPFGLVEWVRKDHVTLKKFPGYFKPGLPYLDGLNFRVIPDDSVKLTNLRTGAVDIIDAIPPKDVGTVKRDPQIVFTESAGLGYSDVILNLKRAPFASAALRQALAVAIDRDAIQRVIFFNTGRPSQGPIAPGHFAYEPAFAPFKADPARVKAKLAEGGEPNGFSFTMKVINTPLQIQIAQLLQAQAREAAIDVKIELLDFTTLLSQLRAKDFAAILIWWSGRIDPDGNMFPQFITGGAFNDGSYANPAVDKALTTGRTSLDPKVRAAAYREAQKLIAEEVAMVFLHHDAILIGHRKPVQGFVNLPDGMLHLERVWLS